MLPTSLKDAASERYGIDLPENFKAEFANLIEYLAKEDFKQYFVHMYMVEPRVSFIISSFQRYRGYKEEDWPMESLQKIVTRMKITREIRTARQAYLQKFNDFFTSQLSAILDIKAAKKILTICDSTSTTEVASLDSMPSLVPQS